MFELAAAMLSIVLRFVLGQYLQAGRIELGHAKLDKDGGRILLHLASSCALVTGKAQVVYVLT